MDLIGEDDWLSQVQQSDVTVQVFPPVVLGVDDDLVDRHDLLNAALKPAKMTCIMLTGLQNTNRTIMQAGGASYLALLCFPRRTSKSLMVKFLFQGG